MPASLFHAALERIFRSCGEPPPAVVVAALSGGMDSVVMLHLLSRAGDLLPAGCRLIAAHLDHGLRPESVEDAAFCREYAGRLGVEFSERRVDVAALAKAEGIGIEEAGRRARYRFFRELAGENGLVVTGHHADDQAETILLHLRRGAHRRGLSGMREFGNAGGNTGTVYLFPKMEIGILSPHFPLGRPLLGIPQSALREYALAHGLEWRVDATNADNRFARNKIRNKILPALERLLPGFRDRLLARAAATAKKEDELAREGAALAAALTRREGGGRFFRVAENAGAEQAERFAYALRHVVEEETGVRLASAAVLTRLATLAENGRLGETVTLPGGLRVRRERDGLFFFAAGAGENTGNAGTVYLFPELEIGILSPHFPSDFPSGLEITASREILTALPPPDDRADPHVEYIRADAVRGALRLRPPYAGERFRPLGAPGSRKIQDMLVDAKIPRRLRTLPRVLADDEGALWVWPLRLAERARLPLFPCAEPVPALRVVIRKLPEQL